MGPFRYAQFCPVARAAEIVGERWTVLLARELLCGPQRFSDLRRRLPGLSSSVLTERLERLEALGLVARRELPPPAPATLYELTDRGRAFEPVVRELARFGLHFLAPAEPGDHLEPEWLRIGVEAFAKTGPTPPHSFRIRVRREEGGEVAFAVRGGPGGTAVLDAAADVEASVLGDPLVLLGLLSGGLDPEAALGSGAIEVDGDVAALASLPALFAMSPSSSEPPPSGAGSPTERGE